MTVETHRFNHGPCLNCSSPLTGLTGPQGASPGKGDIMVCALCSHVIEGTSERLAELSDEAIRTGDPEVVAAVIETAAFRRWLERSSNRNSAGAYQRWLKAQGIEPP